MFNSNDADKPVTGDVVFLAVPYPAVADVLAQRGDQLAGKVLVGITKNPLNFETFDPLVVPADASAAAKTASSPPRPRVLKAFNTNVAAPLASGAVGERPTTVLIAGGDADAKSVLAASCAGGLRPINAGSLARARELEALGFLQITLAAAEKLAWTGGFAVA